MNVRHLLRCAPAHAACAGLAIALCVSLAGAQQPTTTFEEVVTDNGSRIWSFPDDGGDRFVLLIQVGSGSRDEDPEQAGIAHLVEHVLFTSTSSSSKKDLERALDEHGGDINGFTDHERTAFYITTSASQWRFAVEWLSQHVFQPAFLPADVEAQRRIVCEELDLDNPHAGTLTYEELLYPDHALGRSIGGDDSSVRGLSVGDLKRFYAEHYRATNIAVGFAGRVPRSECIASIGAALASLPAGEVTRTSPPVRPHAGTLIYGSSDTSASGSVTLGYHLPPAGARELAIQLAIAFYLQGRFSDEVREARQMSYAPEVELHHFSDTHRLQFDTQVSDENNLPAVVAICDALIEELRQPDTARLERVRDSLSGVLETNSADALAKAMELGWLAHLHGVESPEALIRAVDHLDVATVAAYAAKNLTPNNRFLISSSVLLSTGPNAWLMVAIAVLILVVIDGARGFALTRALTERWSDRRRRQTKPPPKRPKQAVAPKIEPIDANELEASIQRYFKAQDRKRDD